MAIACIEMCLWCTAYTWVKELILNVLIKSMNYNSLGCKQPYITWAWILK